MTGGRAGVALVALTGLVVVMAPLMTSHPPLEMARGEELQPPSLKHPMGTDQFGRDVWSRLAFGGRVSLVVGVVAVAIGSVVGVLSGLIAGFLGGAVDAGIMRFYEGLYVFPGVLLAIAIAAVLGPSPSTVALAVAIVNMPTFARLTRSTALAEREQEYVVAARSVGVPESGILFRHLLPNLLPPVLVQVQVAMAHAVLLEAGLSFLGLGTRPPDPSWGGMLNESRGFLRQAPWMAIYPGLILSAFVFGLFLLGDALQDALSGRRLVGTRRVEGSQ
jgi:peptide/nickel transport system permease protein